MSWSRASDLYRDPDVFKGGIDPSDIKQGLLGNCYFLVCLSSMAEIPGRIEEMFSHLTREINDSGIYLVYFYLNGIRTPVVVDDYFPSYNGRIAFSKSNDGELWVSILEKAWAKLHGTYARTAGGMPYFAANHLTGVPTESFDNAEYLGNRQKAEELFDRMDEADRKNYTLMAASPGSGERDLGSGIAAGHAYSIVEIHKVHSQGR